MRPLGTPNPKHLITARPLRPEPDVETRPFWLWRQPKGIDSLSAWNEIGQEHCLDMANLMFEDRKLRSRYGTELLGGEAGATVLQAVDFIRANGKKVTVRFCTRHIEVYNYLDDAWRVFPIDLHGGEDDLFTWTSWADKLLFSNFVDGLWELNFQTYEIAKVPGAPGAKHLTVFGGRVVATSINTLSASRPARIQWSVKNNYLDWSGIGSGFEDMYGTPGGVVDEAMATIPSTDEAAFVIRASSIWQMSLSGVATAPFRFSRILRVGCPNRYTIVETPRGIVFINTKSVYLISVGSFTDIGQRIINAMQDVFEDDSRAAYAMYDVNRDEYRVCSHEFVFRYRWDEEGWTKDEYPYDLKSLGGQIAGKTGYPIDSLPDTVDDLPGTIDELVEERLEDDKIMLVPTNSLFTMRENSDSPPEDQLEDEDSIGIPWYIITGVINPDLLEASEVLEAHLEYIADSAQTVDVGTIRGTDLGTLILLSTKVLVTSDESEIARIKLEKVSRRLQLALGSEALGELKLLGFAVGTVRVHRAS